MKAPIELLRCWLHETQRVYGDRLLEEKDLEMLNKLQVDITKKIFEVRNISRCKVLTAFSVTHSYETILIHQVNDVALVYM